MMEHLYWESPNWRDDRALKHRSVYKKKWALKPTICADGTKIWFKSYYSHYRIWSTKHAYDSEYSHKDHVENITEAEYIVRKLADNL